MRSLFTAAICLHASVGCRSSTIRGQFPNKASLLEGITCTFQKVVELWIILNIDCVALFIYGSAWILLNFFFSLRWKKWVPKFRNAAWHWLLLLVSWQILVEEWSVLQPINCMLYICGVVMFQYHRLPVCVSAQSSSLCLSRADLITWVAS